MLEELHVTLTRRVRTPLAPEKALRHLDQIAEWPVVVLDYRAVRDAIELSASGKLSFWNALVLDAAARAGAKRLYTEDLQDGQTVLGVGVVNPFRE